MGMDLYRAGKLEEADKAMERAFNEKPREALLENPGVVFRLAEETGLYFRFSTRYWTNLNRLLPEFGWTHGELEEELSVEQAAELANVVEKILEAVEAFPETMREPESLNSAILTKEPNDKDIESLEQMVFKAADVIQPCDTDSVDERLRHFKHPSLADKLTRFAEFYRGGGFEVH